MVCRRIIIGAVVGPVTEAGVTVREKLDLLFATAKPVEASVNQLHFPLGNCVVDDAGSGGVVSLDRDGG